MNKENLHDKILGELGNKHATNQPIDIYEVVQLVDLSSDYLKVRDWLVNSKICNKSEWRKALEFRKVVDCLGKYPDSVTEYLNLWIKKNDVKIDYKGAISCKQDITYEGISVSDEIVKIDVQIEEETDENQIRRLRDDKVLYENIVACKTMQIHIDDICRKMRLLARELNLKVSPTDIEDAIQEWVKAERPKRKMSIYETIMFSNSVNVRKNSEDEWRKLVKACFNTENMSEDLIIAIFQKFIYQVKSKMINRTITNHLMPVLLGPQGVGKSTFMEMLVNPMKELQASTDFAQITDDRNIDLWENFVLVMDEMGYASKADIDSVKHHVTAPVLIRRIMRTNNVISVKQNATFIGASNKEMAQLIRDETGIRRFAGVRYLNKPDWNALNEIDFIMLWQSVDERGKDPITPFIDELRSTQEECRSMRPAEEWLNTLGNIYKNDDFESESVWYSRYKEWEKSHYEKFRMDVSEWRLEIKRLSKQSDDPFPMEITKKFGIDYYKYLGKNIQTEYDEPERVESKIDPDKIKERLKNLNKPRSRVSQYTMKNNPKGSSSKKDGKELKETIEKLKGNYIESKKDS